MATRAEELYEEDFYAWTRDQARALRRLAATHPHVALDFPHLIEEVADLGISERDAVRSQTRRVVEHCLKLEYSSARDPRVGWYETVIGARTVLEDKLMRSLHRGLRRRLPSSTNRRGALPPARSVSMASGRQRTRSLKSVPIASPTYFATTGTRKVATARLRDVDD